MIEIAMKRNISNSIHCKKTMKLSQGFSRGQKKPQPKRMYNHNQSLTTPEGLGGTYESCPPRFIVGWRSYFYGPIVAVLKYYSYIVVLMIMKHSILDTIKGVMLEEENAKSFLSQIVDQFTGKKRAPFYLSSFQCDIKAMET